MVMDGHHGATGKRGPSDMTCAMYGQVLRKVQVRWSFGARSVWRFLGLPARNLSLHARGGRGRAR